MQTITQFVGSEGPIGSLVEDDDGVRFLAVLESDMVIPTEVWVDAFSQGATGIVHVEDGWFRFVTSEEFAERRAERPDGLQVDRWHRADGEVSYRALSASLRAPEAPAEPTHRPMVHTHTHTEYSPLDGLSRAHEVVGEAVAQGCDAVAITDHHTCAGHPDFAKACKEHGIKAIFGMEANFVEDRHVREDRYDYRHLVLIATNQVGLRNLWALTTESNRSGYYGRPRADWELLERFNEGLIATTACLRGPTAWWVKEGDTEKASQALSRLHSIFGDRLYIEMHANGLEDQQKVNAWHVEASRAFGIPMVMAVDSHYTHAEEHYVHDAWIAAQTGGDMDDEQDLFAGDASYHMATEEEVRARPDLPPEVYDEAIANTLVLADRCEVLKIVRDPDPPLYFPESLGTREERQQADVARLVDICVENWERKITRRTPPERLGEYMDRFQEEMGLLIRKGFSGYYLIVADYVGYAKRHGVLVGPGRGSGGGSLVAYLAEITEIDPVEAGLLFERFLTEGRTSLPDFDIDFPSSKQEWMFDYIQERWGEKRVVRIGTNLRMKNKGVVAALFTALKSRMDLHFPDKEAISKIITGAEASTAGLGMPWDELWDQYEEELGPYRRKYPELFDLADKMVGRLKSYGKHAAGVIISTDEDLTGLLPLRHTGEGEPMVSEFDMHAAEAFGLVKFDFLNLRNLDTIQDTIDLIREGGEEIDLYGWIEEYEDSKVWEEVSNGHVLGMFQVETSSGTRMCRRAEPRSMRELADVITIVRPGPMRSGLTDRYVERKFGREIVDFPHPLLEEALADTYGVIIYQEQVMKTCQLLAGYSLEEADGVRKILGKKKVELARAEGEVFKRRSAENGIDPALAESIWAQMEEFALYSFCKAHAWAYAMIGYWTEWLKVHYPGQFLTSVLSTVKQERVPEFVGEARRLDYKVLPPDVNESNIGFTLTPSGIRYGLLAVKGIGEAKVTPILANRPYTEFSDFRERSGADAGVVRLLARVGALDSLAPSRAALEAVLAAEKDGTNKACSWKQEGAEGPNGLPCTFDWVNEPPPISERTGRPLKRKPLPKKCFAGCRKYTPPPPLTLENVQVPSYTPEDIRQIEVEMLGVWLTSTPFDDIAPEHKEMCATAEEIVQGGQFGEFVVLGVIERIKPHMDRNGNPMAFTSVLTEQGSLDVTIFGSTWEKYHRDLQVGALCFAVVEYNERGSNLKAYQKI